MNTAASRMKSPQEGRPNAPAQNVDVSARLFVGLQQSHHRSSRVLPPDGAKHLGLADLPKGSNPRLKRFEDSTKVGILCAMQGQDCLSGF